MYEIWHADLKKAVAEGEALFIVGTGVSIAATNGAECASWTGLLKHGAHRCVDVAVPKLRGDWEVDVCKEIDSEDLDDLLSAAEKVSRKLRAPDGGEWSRWLRESVGELKIHDRQVLEALRDLNLPLATTNYDHLLATVTGREVVPWTEKRKIEQVIRRERQGIVHLHGHWDDPKSVVLGIRSYEKVLGDEHAQATLRALAFMKTLVFVGFDAGLNDPNFGALLKWTEQVFVQSEYRRFRLVRESKVEQVRAQHPIEQRLFVLSYGPDYSDLAPFLRSLGSFQPAHAPGPSASPSARAIIPAAPRIFGREDKVQELIAAILADKPDPIPALGGPGIGKTAVTLVALNDNAVIARFGDRRYFVRCDAAKSRRELASTIAKNMGLSAPSDPEQAIQAFLEREPALLVLDNAETPWENDLLPVEELLGILGRCCCGAMVVSMRGHERPQEVSWRQPIELTRLDDDSAREAFLEIAGKEFADDPRVRDLCKELEGVPLAITLMALAAQGESDLEGIWSRWQSERTAMLKRDKGDHPLTSLDLSYQISIHGDRMNPEARELLSVLSLLPDGLAHQDLPEIHPHGHRAASTLRKVGLAFDEAGRLRVLAPLREHVTKKYPPEKDALDPVVSHFVELALEHGDTVGREGGAEAVQRLSQEVGNVEAMLIRALTREASEETIQASVDWGEFVRFTGLGSIRPLAAALAAAEALGLVQDQANCIKRLGDIALRRSDHDLARAQYEKAIPLYQKVGSILGEANCIQSLGDIARERSDHHTARSQYEKALGLYQRIPEPYSIGGCHRRLARIASDERTREEHVAKAREAWESIDRPDLVANLEKEFGE